MKNVHHSSEQGYVLVGALIVLALGLVLGAVMLNSSATNAKARALVTTQSEYYYEVEETLNKVVAWLQDNSKSVVTAFNQANFSTNFDLGAPVSGDNEGQHFDVPTMVKMAGTNDSVMLSNNPFFGTSAFPATENIDTGTPFDAITAFENADLGGANARLILVWAQETDGSYEPVFRVDVMTGNNPDRGVHSYSYVYTTLVNTNVTSPLSFYGRDFLTLNTPNNTCRSYQYVHDGTSWDRGAYRSNCGIASDAMITVSSTVSGSAMSLSNPGITEAAPNGTISVDKCEGAGCHSYSLPAMGAFEDYCPTNNGDLTINSNTTLPSGGCWRNVEISNHRTLYLTDTSNPYYFKFVDFRANFAHLSFGAGGVIPPGNKVTVYVERVNNDHINGNQFYNSLNAPHQVEFNYIGTNTLTLNGTSALNAYLTAPNASVVVSGNFNYYGGIWAEDLLVSGAATLWADEEAASSSPQLSDMNFALKKTSQRYR